ncbi:beta-L-arabinofuranosidase domain-containing protein [Niabella sp. CJ426]|uniref:beta-L-arabinofuranosidase domain-containing protein n=1 Tax=Niabella sp. CJ426 TaxID=3393740 RepID=UPI003D00F47B
MKSKYLIAYFLICFAIIINTDVGASVAPRQKVQYVIPDAFPLQFPQQNILSGYLGDRYFQNLNNRLLKIDEQGLLDGFLNRPGKQRWVGEHVGKYLESAANTWTTTQNNPLKIQMDRVFNTLISTQKPDGYLGTYLPENYWTSWDVWVHKYDIYGLLAYYRVTGDQRAIDAAIKIGGLLCNNFGDGQGQKNILKAGSHTGMAATSVLDPMLDLYMWTADKKYLEFCKYIIRSYDFAGGPAIVQTLLKDKQVNKVGNAKAYEMLSNILGLVKMYRLTGDKNLLSVSNNAFDDITSKRLYITGSSSDHEHFLADNILKADTAARMGEGCVTTTWLQFNMQMFSITGNLKFYNEIEKSVYNHLLGAENPQTGCVSYYTPLMGAKPYRCNITCCLSSIPRGISLLPLINYGRINNIPTLLMYEAASIRDSIETGKEKLSIGLDIKSEFPENGKAKILVKLPKRAKATLQLRVPVWATNFTAVINGKTYTGQPNQIIKIERLWNNRDEISVSFSIPVSIIDGGKSYPGYFAIRRGPQILSVDQSINKDSNLFDDIVYPTAGKYKLLETNSKLPTGWAGRQCYTMQLVSNGNKPKDLVLVPYADASQTGAEAFVWIKSNKSITDN